MEPRRMDMAQSARSSLWRVFQQAHSEGFAILSVVILVLKGHCVLDADRKLFEGCGEKVEQLRKLQQEVKDPIFTQHINLPQYLHAALEHFRALALNPIGWHPASWECTLVSPLYFLELYGPETLHPGAITEWDEVNVEFVAELSESLELSILEVLAMQNHVAAAVEEIHSIMETLRIETQRCSALIQTEQGSIKQTQQDIQATAEGFAAAVAPVVVSMPVSSLPSVAGFDLLFEYLHSLIEIRARSAHLDVDSWAKDLLEDFDFRLNEDCEHLITFIREKFSRFNKVQHWQLAELARETTSKLRHMNSLAQQELQWLESKCLEVEHSFNTTRSQTNKWAAAKFGLGTVALGAASLATGGAVAGVLVFGGTVALGSSAVDKRSASRCAEVLAKVKGLVAHVARIRADAVARMEELESKAQLRQHARLACV